MYLSINFRFHKKNQRLYYKNKKVRRGILNSPKFSWFSNFVELYRQTEVSKTACSGGNENQGSRGGIQLENDAIMKLLF